MGPGLNSDMAAMMSEKLLCFDVECNRQSLAVDFDFKGVGVAALEVNFVDIGRNHDGDASFAAFTLIYGEGDQLALIGGPFEFFCYFPCESVFVATQAVGIFFEIGD